jgi:hypothetical protein
LKQETAVTLTDYLAGAMISFGSVYFWLLLTSKTNSISISILSILIYVLGATASSYFVGRKAGSQHLYVGFKTALISWGFTIISLFSISKITSSFMVLLLICFLTGSIIGASIALKHRIIEPTVESEEDKQ